VTTETAPGEVLRASPFVGLAETTLRFILLVAVTLAASINASHYVYLVVRTDATVAAIRTCSTASATNRSGPYRTESAACYAEQVAHPLAVGIAVGLAITVAVLVAIIVFGAALTRSRHRRGQPTGEATSELTAEVAGLARLMGVRPPSVVFDPEPGGTARVVAAGFGPPRLVLGGGMLSAWARRRDQFRAILAHELAHIRNADVRLAEVSVAAWWALALSVLLPYLVAAAASGYFASTVPVTVKLLVVLGLALLLRNALLRSRELEADIRASALPEAREALVQVLSGPQQRTRARIWSSHPSAAARVETIAHPDRVLRASWLDFLTLAATGYFLVPALSFWLEQMTFGRPISTWAYSLASWLVAAGIGAGVWALCWRAAVAERVTAHLALSRLRSALALTAGSVLGAFLTPLPRATGSLVDQHTLGQWLSIVCVVFVASLVTTAVALALARRAVQSASETPRRSRIQLVGLVASVALAALALEAARRFVLFSPPEASVTLSLLGTVGALVLAPSTYALAVVVVAGTIVIFAERRLAASAIPDWMLLDEVPVRG
jgi:Zn-dependent protease with chaperone function